MNQGTSRTERALSSLNPTNFKLDARSITELFEDTKIFAKTVVFEDADISTDWEAFFEEGQQYLEKVQATSLKSNLLKDCPPHLGLFLAFLQLFQSVQEQFNALSAAHLKFFYQKILKQEAFKMKPDHAYIFLELARNTAKLYLEKGTEMIAGKDADNNDLVYATDKDIFLNKAKVAVCKAIYIGKSSNDSIYAYDNVAEIQELLGGTVTQNETIPNEGWYPFGNPRLLRKSAAIGFGVSSPILVLEEGRRVIRILMTLEESNQEAVFANKLDETVLEVHLSTAEGWLIKPVHTISKDGNTLIFELIIDKLDPPIQAMGEIAEIHSFQKIAYPILKVMLKQGYSYRTYEVLQKMKLSSVAIDVSVSGMEALTVKNDYGLLEIEQNLQPFGFTPMVGANFYVHAKELTHKNVKTATLKMHWKALPENFKAYYEGYKGETNSLVERIEDFKINIAQRKNKEWIAMLNSNGPLFNLFEEHLEFKASPKDIEKGIVVTSEPDNGTIRMTLAAPHDAFGHAIYPAVYTRAIMSQVQQKDAPIPNQPYTPTVEAIQMSYEASEVFDTSEVANNQHFFHIEPFGASIISVGSSSFSLISENYNSGGQLFLGIDHLHPPEQLNLFFEIKDEQILEIPNIKMAYLGTSGWKLFSKNQLLSDATRGLKQTGIITLNIPADASKEGGVMPRGLFWIKLMASKFPERFDRILTIRTNAVQCTLNANDIASDFKVNDLTPGTIKSLTKKNSQLKKIEQPYSTFGGEAAESDESFFTRISERLSHKNRGISSWDLERLVLQEFPRIYQVICYSNMDAYGTVKAGHIHTVIIPQVDSSDQNRIRKPLASAALIQRVESYLQMQISPHVHLSVGNPTYEELKITANVSFKDQVDAGFYLEKLENDIKKYLSPWAFDRALKIEMGTSFFVSSLIKFIELQPYINFVASVKVNKDGKRIRANEIKAGPQAILISSDRHNLQIVEPNTVMCQTNQGVAQMIVDINFQVE